MEIPVAEPVPIWVKEKNAWVAATVLMVAIIVGGAMWIASNQATGTSFPGGSNGPLLPASDPPTQTPWVVTSTPSPTPAMTATARVVTATPSPTNEAINCNLAQAGQTCTRYPGVSTATALPRWCSTIPDTVGVPVTCRKDPNGTEGETQTQ